MDHELPGSIVSRVDLRTFLQEDLAANGLERWRWDSPRRHPTVHYLRLLRRVEYLLAQQGLWARARRFVVRARLQKAGLRTGISLPPGVAGPGLSLPHYGTLVINKRARIGSHCHIHPNVTVGVARGGVPAIGRRVYIGPGAVLYGAITVGDDAAIGANSVVGRDVPAGKTVAGAPARVISQHGSASLMPVRLQPSTT